MNLIAATPLIIENIKVSKISRGRFVKSSERNKDGKIGCTTQDELI